MILSPTDIKKMLIEDFINSRKRNGFLTQKDLADYYGISINTVKSWECGRNKIPNWIYRAMKDKTDAEKYHNSIDNKTF